MDLLAIKTKLTSFVGVETQGTLEKVICTKQYKFKFINSYVAWRLQNWIHVASDIHLKHFSDAVLLICLYFLEFLLFQRDNIVPEFGMSVGMQHIQIVAYREGKPTWICFQDTKFLNVVRIWDHYLLWYNTFSFWESTLVNSLYLIIYNKKEEYI